MFCTVVEFFLNNPLVLVLAGVVYLIFSYYRHWNHLRYLTREVPGPPCYPVFGNLNIFTDTTSFSEVNYIIYRAFDKYGSVFKLWMAHELWVCLSDNKLIKEVLEFWRSYDAVPSYNFFGYAKETFCVKSTFYGKKEYFDVAVQPAVEEDKVTEACERLSKSLKAKVEKGQTTVEEIATCLNDCIQHIYNETLWKVQLREDYRQRINLPLQDRWDLFLLRLVKVPTQWALELLAKYTDQPKLLAGINVQTAVFEKVPVKEEGIMQRLGKLRHDFLNIEFTEKRLNDMTQIAFDYTARELTECCEQSTAFLLNLLQEIAAHPDAGRKIREEMRQVMAKNGGKRPTMCQERKLFYTEMVINEGLRLYSPPAIFRRVGKDFTSGNKTIPNDSMVFISVHHLHRNHAFYEEPMKFYPDHFSREVDKIRPLSTFFPLELTPVNSTDSRFGLKIVKLIVAMLCEQFSFETNIQTDNITRDYFLLRKNVDAIDLRVKKL